jgi:hypothetical protein
MNQTSGLAKSASRNNLTPPPRLLEHFRRPNTDVDCRTALSRPVGTLRSLIPDLLGFALFGCD